MLLPPVCPVCGSVGSAPCRRCLATLHPAPALPTPPGVDRCLALLAYEGSGRELVARIKYRNNRAALAGLGRAMASLLPPPTGGPLLLTWAPTTPERRRERGFDQAELLARAVGRRVGARPLPLLRRGRGRPQTGRTRAERYLGPTFEAVRPVRGAVVVVDDVVTSGATLSAAAEALRSAGAATVTGLCAARTPAPGSVPPRVVETAPQGGSRW